MKTRQEYNIDICNKLLDVISKDENKDLRFHQLLFRLKISESSLNEDLAIMVGKDKFNEESSLTFEQLCENTQ